MDFGEGRRGKRWERERKGRKVGERKKKCKWGQKEGEGKIMEREEGRRKEFCAVVIFHRKNPVSMCRCLSLILASDAVSRCAICTSSRCAIVDQVHRGALQ